MARVVRASSSASGIAENFTQLAVDFEKLPIDRRVRHAHRRLFERGAKALLVDARIPFRMILHRQSVTFMVRSMGMGFEMPGHRRGSPGKLYLCPHFSNIREYPVIGS